MADMGWVWIFAALIVVLVAGAVLPRRTGLPGEGFPWFWVAFPIAVFLVAATVSIWLPPIAEAGRWSMYMPLADRPGGMQYLGNEQRWLLRAYLIGRWIVPIAALTAMGLSAWSWRRGRV